MTTANPFVQFASKVGRGCEKAWGKEKTGKLSTVEVASFKPSKRIALAMMGWVMRSSDKVSARDSKSNLKNMISINSWVRTYPNRGIKRRKTNRSWAQVILSPPDSSSLVDTTFQLNSNTSRLSIERQCKVRLHRPRKIISGDLPFVPSEGIDYVLELANTRDDEGKKKTTKVVWRSRKTSTGDWSLSVEDDLDSCEERKGHGAVRNKECTECLHAPSTLTYFLHMQRRFSFHDVSPDPDPSWDSIWICCSRRNSTSTRGW